MNKLQHQGSLEEPHIHNNLVPPDHGAATSGCGFTHLPIKQVDWKSPRISRLPLKPIA